VSDGGWLLSIVGVFAAATVGVLVGVWIGSEIEPGIYEDILEKANLPGECWARISAGAEKLVSELEGIGRPAEGAE
jgi:hypothetical protein